MRLEAGPKLIIMIAIPQLNSSNKQNVFIDGWVINLEQINKLYACSK